MLFSSPRNWLLRADMLSHRDHAGITNLVELLRRRVDEPADLGLRFHLGRDAASVELSFAQLDRRARAVAAVLRERDLVGERALLCYPPGLEFMVGLYGSLYAGLVAVPAYPPRAHKPDARLASIAASCRPAVVLTTAELFADRERLVAQMPQLREVPWLATEAVADERAEQWQPTTIRADDLAVLQYTSGSTGDPKGVMLTHRCVLHNVAGISHAMRLGRGSIGVTWLPAFHDMGLIGNLLGVIYYPGCLHVLSPMAMLQDPFRWLELVSRTRAYISGGPSFAFEQCVKRITAEQRQQLDLSEWKLAYVGAEPISPRILEEFARTFAECGFQSEYFYPCYGLAESSLMVTGGLAQQGPAVRRFAGEALERDRVEVAAEGRALVGCGAAIPEMDVRIVDPRTQVEVETNQIGEVWISGPSVAAGYFERADATEETFGADLEGRRWLRSGDLGFFHDGELFLAGRLKDVLILRGRNFYPQDLEEVAQLASPLLKAGGGAAFTCDDLDGARLVLVYEVGRNYKPGPTEVYELARAAIAEEFAIELSELVLIRAGSLPRTSSGKVARRETKQRSEAGTLDVVERFTAPHNQPDAQMPNQPDAQAPGITVRDWLVARLARQLNLSPAQIDVDKPFASSGLDSLAMVQIAGDLERWLGRPLSPTMLYSAPTITSLAHALTAQPEAIGSTPSIPQSTGIAIIGLGCRFPGAEGPEAFWQLLREGHTAIRDVPADRGLPAMRGGFLDAVRGFDAGFFSISPREAAWIDPQHRLLLETTYHAFEDAGIPVEGLAGKSVGVFVGISSNDYGHLVSGHAGNDTYLATGNAKSMAAHRVSYHLDLRGPSLAVDTACSSSLTAVHQAVQALRNGECELAVAAGVNLLFTADVTEALTRAQMLSPSGRCKTFDAAADGYVRGEGVGVVVLKPVANAERDGDPIYAVIEATGVNQDGRSNGITAPNGAAQTALIRQVLARAGRGAADIACVETHGTGTALGDPIEFDALAAALGDASEPCALGAVKANVGHLEAAAGIAGLIKSALQLRHGQIAPLVGLETLNPLIRLEGTHFHLPRTATEWKRTEHPRLCGVSSFGFGGSNAHVLLVEPLTSPAPFTVSRIPARHLLPLSARSDQALRDTASQLATWLRTHDVSFPDVAHTLATGRTHHPHRLVVQAHDTDDLLATLDQWTRTGRAPHAHSGKPSPDRPTKLAFLFTGQGSAYAGMAKSLSDHEVFRTTLDRCDKIVRSLAGWSVRETLYDASRIDETEFGQPALFAFEIALTTQWESWGVEPVAVLGHSVGEIVAACVAGVLSLEDALKLIVARGRRMQACPPGAMLACLAPAEQLRPTRERYGSRLTLAADNGPRQCVLSGDPGTIAAVTMELTEAGIETRSLNVSRAFHSALIEPALDSLRRVAATLTHQPSRIAFVSNVTGDVTATVTPAYWADHARASVRFAAGIRTLHQLGVTHYVEIGPAAVLSRLGPTCLLGTEATWLSSADDNELQRGLARLHVDGVNLNWPGIQPRGRRISLPGYPFQHREYWYTDLPCRNAPATPPKPEAGWRLRSCWAQQLPRSNPNFAPLNSGTCLDAAWGEQSLAAGQELRPQFDRLAGLYVVSAFERLGWHPTPGEATTLATLATRLGVADHKRRLLHRLTQLAAEDGWLDLRHDEIQVRSRPSSVDPTQLHNDLLERYPDYEVELRLAHHCARHLAPVLQGTVDPLQVLFDGEAGQWTSEIYSRAPVARFYNALLTRAVEQLLTSLPTDRPVRILELGAGTGGTTQALLPILPRGHTEYVFTDVSSLFLSRARVQFAQYEAVDYHVLDLERSPSEQGFAAGQFDLVVASNVLHATADLRQSVRHARQLLTAGGMLVLLEGTGPRRLLDLIFGLTEGWWRFTDDGVRPVYPLIAPAAWRRLLAEEGFEAIEVFPEDDARLPDPDQVVLLARSASHREQVPIPATHELTAQLVEQLIATPPNETVVLPRSSEETWLVTRGEWPTTTEPNTRRIDLDPAYPVETQAAILIEALLHSDKEPIVAFRGDRRYVPRSSPVQPIADPIAPQVQAPDRATLLAASAFERRALVESYLRQELASLLGATLTDEDMDQPVQALGLDSLLAIQVRNRVETSLGVALSLVDFLKGLRVRQLVDNIVAQLADPSRPPQETEEPAAVPTEEVGTLSERELDSLLVSLLDHAATGSRPLP